MPRPMGSIACKLRSKTNRFELDRLEQYSRKDSVRIFGIPETPNENTNDLVIDLGQEIGVEIKPEDISVAHRLPPKCGKDGNKPIIVKFVQKDTKDKLMKNKRNL